MFSFCSCLLTKQHASAEAVCLHWDGVFGHRLILIHHEVVVIIKEYYILLASLLYCIVLCSYKTQFHVGDGMITKRVSEQEEPAHDDCVWKWLYYGWDMEKLLY